MNYSQIGQFRSSPPKRKTVTEPSFIPEPIKNKFIIHHLAAPSNGPLRFDKIRPNYRQSLQNSLLSRTVMKSSIKTEPDKP